MLRLNPMTRVLLGRTLLIGLGLFALIEAIYITEEFTTIMENVVISGGDALDLFLLLLLRAPEVVDFALPLVLYLAIFFAIIGARDSNEMIVCAASGVSWWRIPIFAIWAGLFGAAISIAFSAAIAPASAYAFRLASLQLVTERLVRDITEPGRLSTVQSVKRRTVISSPPTDPEAERGTLFVFHPDDGNGWKVNRAQDWTIIGPDETDAYALQMEGFSEFRGQSTAAAEAPVDNSLSAVLSRNQFQFQNVEMAFRMDQLLPPIDKARRLKETPIFTEPIALDAPENQRVARRLGEAIARALAVALAALAAVPTAAWAGTRTGRYLALPLGCIAVLGTEVVARTILGDAARQGMPAIWTTMASFTAIALVLPLAYTLWRGERMITPATGRS